MSETTNMQNDTNVRGEITALKSLLADSDYSILKTLEGLLNCTSATGIITFLKDVTSDIKEIVAKRAAWRARINELEEQYYTPAPAAGVPEDNVTPDDASADA